MHVDSIQKRYKNKVYTYTLLRQTYRQGGKVHHRTLANLSALPEDVIRLIRLALKGETLVPAGKAFRIIRSRSHGAVWAVYQTIKRLGLDRVLRLPQAWADRVLAMIVARVVQPGSKRSTAGWWRRTSLPELLPGAEVSVQVLYEAMDALLLRQPVIEQELARQQLGHGRLVLYDVTSSYLEGRTCPLARFGYNRDGKRGKRQVVWGLLTNAAGCPVAIEVFRGDFRDPETLPGQVHKLKQQFGFEEVVVVGDRGMITRLHRSTLESHGYGWITALKASQIRKLRKQGLIQLSFFDERDLAEVVDPRRPTERLVLCRNPLVCAERRRKREELLEATEARLNTLKSRVSKGRLKDEKKIALEVGKVIDRFKVGKHFKLAIGPGKLEFWRDVEAINQEAALDGLYIIQTNVPTEKLSAGEIVAGYKALRQVKRAFRAMKTMYLELRPIYHRLADRVRAHAFLCMLAYYVQWHMEKALAPLREERPEVYQSFSHVMDSLGAIQLNTVEVAGVEFYEPSGLDEEQQLFLRYLSIGSLLPRQVARNRTR